MTMEASSRPRRCSFGQYPDGRSDAKGIEAESLTIDEFGSREFMFVGSERGAFVAVYVIDGGQRPRFVQFLSTGQAPEGLLTIPSRNLFVTANEGDDQDGSISIFEGVPGHSDASADQPRIFSSGVDEPWGALSGLAASPHNPDVLYSVPDNALPSSIYSIDVGESFARIRDRMPVTRGGTPGAVRSRGDCHRHVHRASEKSAGFWLASEGNASSTRNTLIQVDGTGQILREVFLPADVDAPGGRITSNGFEGVTVSSDGRYLLVAVQRPYSGETFGRHGPARPLHSNRAI